MLYGCRKSDFIGNYTNKIAVVFRGNCEFETKAHNALNANASAVVVINTNLEGVFTMSLGDVGGIFNLQVIIKVKTST